jgi:hypothetical protein
MACLQQQIEWCQQQQSSALEHMQTGCTCVHRCSTDSVLQWLEDAVMEEVMLMVEGRKFAECLRCDESPGGHEETPYCSECWEFEAGEWAEAYGLSESARA